MPHSIDASVDDQGRDAPSALSIMQLAQNLV